MILNLRGHAPRSSKYMHDYFFVFSTRFGTGLCVFPSEKVSTSMHDLQYTVLYNYGLAKLNYF